MQGGPARLPIGPQAAWIDAKVQAPESADKPLAEHQVTGILIDRDDAWVTVKADGEDQPVRSVADASNRDLQHSLDYAFSACRAQLTYVNAGKSRQLRSIRRQVLKDRGTLTGDVVRVYDNFWIVRCVCARLVER